MRVPYLWELAPSAAARGFDLNIDPCWTVFNPSIAADEAGFRAIVRSTNFLVRRNRTGVLLDGTVPRTINHLCRLDDDLRLIDFAMLDTSVLTETQPGAAVEDLRLFRLGERWAVLGNVATFTEGGGGMVWRNAMALGYLDGSMVVGGTHFPSPFGAPREKNWMPAVFGERLSMVYSCAPTQVIVHDPVSGATDLKRTGAGPEELASWKGSSQLVGVGDLFFAVIHGTGQGVDGDAYLHRFVAFDRSLTLIAHSPPFTFAGDIIEFCAGMAVRQGRVVISYGRRDEVAALATVKLSDVLRLLDL